MMPAAIFALLVWTTWWAYATAQPPTASFEPAAIYAQYNTGAKMSTFGTCKPHPAVTNWNGWDYITARTTPFVSTGRFACHGVDLRLTWLPTSSPFGDGKELMENNMAVSAVDWNMDRRIDLIVGRANGEVVLYAQGDSTGIYNAPTFSDEPLLLVSAPTSSPTPPTSAPSAAPSAAPTHAPTAPAPAPPGSGSTTRTTTHAASPGGPRRLQAEGDATAAPTDPTASPTVASLAFSKAYARPHAVDWDGDGDLDLLIATAGGVIRYLERISDDDFTEWTLTENDPFQAVDYTALRQDAEHNYVEPTNPLNQGLWVQAVDMDGDGDLDIIVNTGFSPCVHYYERTNKSGSDALTLHLSKSLFNPLYDLMDDVFDRSCSGILWATDWDGDGDFDMVQSYVEARPTGMPKYFERITNFKFAEPETNPFIGLYSDINTEAFTVFTVPIDTVDVDGDGHLDFIYGSPEGPHIVYNKEFESYVQKKADDSPFEGMNPMDSAGVVVAHAADYDGDGMLDLLVAEGNTAGGPYIQIHWRLAPSVLWPDVYILKGQTLLGGATIPQDEVDLSNKTLALYPCIVDWDKDDVKDIILGVSSLTPFERDEGKHVQGDLGNILFLKGTNNPDAPFEYVSNYFSGVVKIGGLMRPQAVDWDDDGHLDLIISGGGDRNQDSWDSVSYDEAKVDYYKGDGTNATVKQIGNDNPFDRNGRIGTYCTYQGNKYASQCSIYIVDFDGDQDLDVLVSDVYDNVVGGARAYRVKYYENRLDGLTEKYTLAEQNEAGGVALHRSTGIPQLFRENLGENHGPVAPDTHHGILQAVDWDQDGDLDVILSNSPTRGEIAYWARNWCKRESGCGNGICDPLLGTCSCSPGYENSDCSACAKGYFTIKEVVHPVLQMTCFLCPSLDTVCSLKGVCGDNHAAQYYSRESNTTVFLSYGDGMCYCNNASYLYGYACEGGDCPSGYELVLQDYIDPVAEVYLYACRECSSGKYRHATDQGAGCTICGRGTCAAIDKNCVSAGATECEECPKGRVAVMGLDACVSCPNGQVSFLGELCARCSPGTYQAAERDWCPPCPNGTYSEEFETVECEKCGPGSWSFIDTEYVDKFSYAAKECNLCTSGKYSTTIGATSQGVCVDCDKGLFSKEPGSTACQRCEAGTFSSGGRQECTLCARGTTAGMAQSACTLCASGRFAKYEGSTECEPCAAGTTSSGQAAYCETCPQGRYSSAGSLCSDCESGRYGNLPGATSSGSCVACAAGTYADVAGARACTPCSSGFFAAGGAVACEACPMAKYSAAQAAACVYCEEGKYNAGISARECASCEPGEYSWSGSTACEVCAPGGYSEFEMLGPYCALCPPGTYSDTIGATSLDSCLPCPPGKQGSDFGASSCESCGAGKFSDTPGVQSCTLCFWGNYSSSEGSSLCDACAGGTFALTEGSRVCSTCSAGSFSEEGWQSCDACPIGRFGVMASSECAFCPAGKFIAFGTLGVSESSCSACDAGRYSGEQGSIMCSPCVAGRFSNAGETECSSCIEGKFSGEATRECNSCEAGRFSTKVGADSSSACLPCSAGQFSSSSAATSCSTCTSGMYSDSGWTSCLKCSVGKYSGAGASQCILCSPGLYGAEEGRSICYSCGFGTTSTAGQSSCAKCPRGQFSGQAASACTVCGAGTYSYDEGSTKCESCPAGTYSSAGVAECLPCAAGTYAVGGAVKCTACPSGRYFPTSGASEESDCLPCALGRWSSTESSISADSCNACLNGATTLDDGVSSDLECIYPDAADFTCHSGFPCSILNVTGSGLVYGHKVGIFKSCYGPMESRTVPGIIPYPGWSDKTNDGSSYYWGSDDAFVPAGGTYQLCWCHGLHDVNCDDTLARPIGQMTIYGAVYAEPFVCVRGRDCQGLVLNGVPVGGERSDGSVLQVLVSCVSDGLAVTEETALPLRLFSSNSNGSAMLSEAWPITFGFGDTPVTINPQVDYNLCWRATSGGYYSLIGHLKIQGPTDGHDIKCSLGQPCNEIMVEGLDLAVGDRIIALLQCGSQSPVVVTGFFSRSYLSIETVTCKGLDSMCEQAFKSSSLSYLVADAGIYELCFCRPLEPDVLCDVSTPADFQALVGLIRAEGPSPRQTFECFIGEMCIIELEGIGLADGGQMVISPSSGPKDFDCTAASGSPEKFGMPTLVANQTSPSNGFNFSKLPEQAAPGRYKLCWRPIQYKVPEFRSLAGILSANCAPGMFELHENEVPEDSQCRICTSGFYCVGGLASAKTKCPTLKTTLAQGSKREKSCVCQGGNSMDDAQVCIPCPTGRYRPLTNDSTSACLFCPNNTTSQIGSSSLVQCYCQPPFRDVDDDPSVFDCAISSDGTGMSFDGRTNAEVPSVVGSFKIDLQGEIVEIVQFKSGFTASLAASMGVDSSGLDFNWTAVFLGERRLRDDLPRRQLEATSYSIPFVLRRETESEALAASENFYLAELGDLLYKLIRMPLEISVERPPTLTTTLLKCRTGLAFPLGIRPTALTQCMCTAGYYPKPGSLVLCQQCAEGEYKRDISNGACTTCPLMTCHPESDACDPIPLSTDGIGKSDAIDCMCPPGYYAPDSMFLSICKPCGIGNFCHGGTHRARCHNGSNTAGRDGDIATTQERCVCNARKSAGRSDLLYKCGCNENYYFKVDDADPAHELGMCELCPDFAAMACLGDFSLDMRGVFQHGPPVSNPGFYMVDYDRAMQCKIKMATDSNRDACNGGFAFSQVLWEGRWPAGNECALGHTGVACGACDLAYARDAGGQGCKSCDDLPPPWALVLSVVVDVFVRAAWALVLAKRTLVARAGKSVDSVVIRIWMQWLATNAVLGQFDFSEVTVYGWTQDKIREKAQQDGDTGNPDMSFQYPGWFHGLWNSLYAFSGSVPDLVGSIQMSVECLAVKWFESDGRSVKLVAPIAFYFLYPLLLWTMLTILLAITAKVVYPGMVRRRRFQKQTIKILLADRFDVADDVISLAVDSMRNGKVGLFMRDAQLFMTDSRLLVNSFGDILTTEIVTSLVMRHQGSKLEAMNVSKASLAQHMESRLHDKDEHFLLADLLDDAESYSAAAKITGDIEVAMRHRREAAAAVEKEVRASAHDRPVREVGPSWMGDWEHAKKTHDAWPCTSWVNEWDEVKGSPVHFAASIVDLIGRESPSTFPSNRQDAHPVESEPSNAKHKSRLNSEFIPYGSISTYRLHAPVQAPIEYDVFGILRGPELRYIIVDAFPVYVIALFTVWDLITKRYLFALQSQEVLINAGGTLESQSRWLGDMRFVMWGPEHQPVAIIAYCGLGIWSLGFLVVLALILRRHQDDLKTPAMLREYGFFYNGLEPHHYLWELSTKRIDLLIVYFVTYTAYVYDVKGKLIVYLLIAAIAWAAHSRAQPFDDRLNSMLDRLETRCLQTRFFTLALIQVLLVTAQPLEVNFVFAGAILGVNMYVIVSTGFLLAMEIVGTHFESARSAKRKTLPDRVKFAVMYVPLQIARPIVRERKYLEDHCIRFLWHGLGLGVKVVQTCGDQGSRFTKLWRTGIRNIYGLSSNSQREYAARIVGQIYDHVLAQGSATYLKPELMDFAFALPIALRNVRKELCEGEIMSIEAIAEEIETLSKGAAMHEDRIIPLPPSRFMPTTIQPLDAPTLRKKALKPHQMEFSVTAEDLCCSLMFLHTLDKIGLHTFIEHCIDRMHCGNEAGLALYKLRYGPRGHIDKID